MIRIATEINADAVCRSLFCEPPNAGLSQFRIGTVQLRLIAAGPRDPR